MTAVSEQALVGYVFAEATAEGLAAVTRIWTAATAAWPPTGTAAGADVVRTGEAAVPEHPPASVPATDGVLCVARSTDRPGLHQMILQRFGDRLCLRGTLSPPDGQWGALRRQWRRVVTPGAAGVATATVLTGLAGGRWRRRAPTGAGTDATPPTGHGWLTADTAQGFRLLAPAAVRPNDDQFLIVIAPPRRAAELDAWTWSDGTAALPPLGRYLMYSAALRHLRAELADLEGPLLERADRVDSDLEALRTLLAEDAARVAPAARRLMLRTELDQIDLTNLRSRVAQLARDGSAAAENQRSAVAAAFPSTTAEHTLRVDRHPLGYDLASGMGISRRAADIADRLAAVEERARHITAAAASAIAADDRVAAQEAQDRGEQLSLRITAVLGALIMLLTAVQAFQYKVDLPGRIRSAIIVGLMATALVLGGWSAERTRSPGAGARRRPPSTVLATSLVVWAASLGWCAESVWSAVRDMPPERGRTLAVAALGAAMALVWHAALRWRTRGRGRRGGAR